MEQEPEQDNNQMEVVDFEPMDVRIFFICSHIQK